MTEESLTKAADTEPEKKKIEFKKPSRRRFRPSVFDPDEDGVLDLGFAEGKMSDDRPYRIECWRMDEMIMASIFIPDIEIEEYGLPDLADLLAAEHVVEFLVPEHYLQARRCLDHLGHEIWYINLTLKNKGVLVARLGVPLQQYKVKED